MGRVTRRTALYVHGLDTATPHYPKPRCNLSSYKTFENWALISLVCPKVAHTADMASIREQASNILFRPFISIAPVVKAIEPPSVKRSPHIWLLWRGVEAFVGVVVIPAVVPLICWCTLRYMRIPGTRCWCMAGPVRVRGIRCFCILRPMRVPGR